MAIMAVTIVIIIFEKLLEMIDKIMIVVVIVEMWVFSTQIKIIMMVSNGNDNNIINNINKRVRDRNFNLREITMRARFN